jgi:hypothetical protein
MKSRRIWYDSSVGNRSRPCGSSSGRYPAVCAIHILQRYLQVSLDGLLNVGS